jgi:NAD-dependent SIR2 family protein deacetylase
MEHPSATILRRQYRRHFGQDPDLGACRAYAARSRSAKVHHGPVTAFTTITTTTADVDALTTMRSLLAAGGVAVLSGAGLSTESGIPDYRGASGALRRALPMNIQEFLESPVARRRYWARSYLGWRQLSRATPNAGHTAVAHWQRAGKLSGIITQNVDGLHQAAGATDVIELHGNLAEAVCVRCGARESRRALDQRLTMANPDFAPRAAALNPDGDAALVDGALERFRMVCCGECGSDLLKPDVVFFGENVPPERVERCYAMVASARALLVLGSSLTVMSGFRFVRRATSLGIAIGIVNQGATRGDSLAAVRIDGTLGQVLPTLYSSPSAGSCADPAAGTTEYALDHGRPVH